MPSIYGNQNTQSYDLTNTHNVNTRIVGQTFGVSREGRKPLIDGAITWGHAIPIGRVVVNSAIYNQSDVHQRQDLSVSLPDATGEFTINPANGLALNHADNAALLATQKVNGEYCFAGFLAYGDNCIDCLCAPCAWEFPDCPVGNPDFHKRSLIAKNQSQASVITHGGVYMWVPSAVALAKGDKLAMVDASVTDACVELLGAVTLAGAGAQDLPDYIYANGPSQETPNGGHIVEIYIGS